MRAPLQPGLVTGVGSLPGAELGPALAWVAQGAPELPFAPELPAAGGGLIDAVVPRALRDAEGRALADPGLLDGPVPAPPGVEALATAVEAGALPAAVALKIQVCGPVTLASLLGWRGRPALEEPELRAALARRVAQAGAAARERLRRTGLPVLLFLDEPMLGLLSPDQLGPAAATLGASLEALVAPDTSLGLHCCSRIPWEMAFDLGIDILSFDPDQEESPLLASPAARALARRAWLAWGLVPTDRDPADLDPAARLSAWRERLAPGLDPAEVAARALVSSSCGLAGVPPAQVPGHFSRARALGAALAALASGQEAADRISTPGRGPHGGSG